MRYTKSELDEILKKKGYSVEELRKNINSQIVNLACQYIVENKSINADEHKITNPKILSFTVPGIPVPAPRQTQRDKWMKRPCVMRYREYGDRLRSFINLNDMYVGKITAKYYLPMPDSWSEKKKAKMDGKPHRSKPDIDNLFKASCDSLLSNDAMIWAGYMEKRWCRKGQERTELTFETTE